jgi:hypothetical protein
MQASQATPADASAIKLQTWWRMAVLRRAYEEARDQWKQIQMAQGVGYGGGESTTVTPEVKAVMKVQRQWRSYMNVRIFRYYRDLISFRERGIPKQLLRCVNPAEAQLLDAASSTHLRFRLGGSIFPPTIYYKVFCHGGLADIGAFAPRDYTVNSGKKPLPQHSMSAAALAKHAKERHHDGWYQRTENNDWRPLSMKLVDEGLDVHLGRDKAQRMFHFSRSVRKEDQELGRRRQKREWLKKMYTQGMDEARRIAESLPEDSQAEDDRVPAGGVGQDAAADLAASPYSADAAVDDGGVDELLSWTEQLDFDLYYNNWLSVATSSRSDRKASTMADMGGDLDFDDADLLFDPVPE